MASYARQLSPSARLMRTVCADREFRIALVRQPSPKAALARLAANVKRERRNGASDAERGRTAVLIQR